MPTGDLTSEISRFSAEHPDGWGHEDWLGFLHRLSEAGHDVEDGDGIGLALENHRLSGVLRGMEIKGLGPKRIQALAGHFGMLWNLRNASPEDLAQLPSVSRSLAEQILDGIR